MYIEKKMSVNDNAIVKSIGKAIKFWRKFEGYDQYKFSEIIGTSRSYIARLETGHVGISLNKLSEMAGILGISPYTIMRGIPNDEEIEILRDFYADIELEVTKAEMEVLFCQRFLDGSVPTEYYEHILSIERGDSYRCKATDENK